jgi:hypothetical protein
LKAPEPLARADVADSDTTTAKATILQMRVLFIVKLLLV